MQEAESRSEVESRLEQLRLDMAEGRPVLKEGGTKGKKTTASGGAGPVEDSADQSDQEGNV